MTDSKHTKGPWTYSENAYGAVFVHGGETLTSSVGTEYKELVAGGNSHDTLTLANARLIAAAPELLKLAIQYRDDLRDPPSAFTVKRRLMAIDAVIAKAEAN